MIYWDHNATTPCAEEVMAAMHRYWQEEFGNAASPHLAGRQAARAVSQARAHVATLAVCNPGEMVFTSGATETNNLVFLGLLLAGVKDGRRRVAVSAIEHKSVLEPAALLGEHGFEVVHLPVTREGVVDVTAAEHLITPEMALVSVQAANNEIGTIQPVADLSYISHQAGAYFHTDAAQALGKIPVDLSAWDCDFASFSAHKLYGPKGVGALFVRGGPRRWPWPYPMRGGGQEGGLRPGTSNVPAIVGFGEACRLATAQLPQEAARLLDLRQRLETTLKANFPDCIIHAENTPRLPGTISVAFPGLQGDAVAAADQDFCVGRGSACGGGHLAPSHVLLNLTDRRELIDGTIRISLGKGSNEKHIGFFMEKIRKTYQR